MASFARPRPTPRCTAPIGASRGAVTADIETLHSVSPTVLVTLNQAVDVLEGDRFVPVVLPSAMRREWNDRPRDRVPEGARELWLASPTDGLFRLRANAWQRFGPNQGLYTFNVLSLTAAATRSVGSPRLYAAGSDGVFGLVGERWQRVRRAPRRAVQVSEVPRASGPGELWVGTEDGRVMRRHGDGAWSELPGESRGDGAVTAIAVVSRTGGEASVYIGSRGERLRRVTFTQARSVALRALPADRTVGVVQPVMVDDRPELWLGTRSGVLRLTPTRSILDRPPGYDLGVVQAIAQHGDAIWVAGARSVAFHDRGGWNDGAAGLGDASIASSWWWAGTGTAGSVMAATSEGSGGGLVRVGSRRIAGRRRGGDIAELPGDSQHGSQCQPTMGSIGVSKKHGDANHTTTARAVGREWSLTCSQHDSATGAPGVGGHCGVGGYAISMSISRGGWRLLHRSARRLPRTSCATSPRVRTGVCTQQTTAVASSAW